MFMPSSITVRRMCQGEVQQVLKVTPWTTTATARGLLRSLSGSLEKKNGLWTPPAAAHPSSSAQLPRQLARAPFCELTAQGSIQQLGKWLLQLL
jgi:hypothetical protein